MRITDRQMARGEQPPRFYAKTERLPHVGGGATEYHLVGIHYLVRLKRWVDRELQERRIRSYLSEDKK